MSMVGERFDVAIIGGGLAGLTVAYRLGQQRPDLRVVVFEAARRPGGELQSERVEHPEGRFLVEAGPDCFLAQKPWARELAVELGLDGELIPINQIPQAVSIIKHGRVIDWPSGLSLLAPTELRPFLRTPLISPLGKVRMALDLVLPSIRSTADESIAAFVRRRLGKEALDWIAEPLMAGIYNADPEQLSLLATFPHLRALELEQGSLIRGLRSARKTQEANAGPRPVFLSFRAGMQTLIDGLIDDTGDAVRCESTVRSLRRDDAGFAVELDRHQEIHANRVVLAVPASVASDLTVTLAPRAANMLGNFRTASSGTISMAFPSAAVRIGPVGYGLVVPRKERRSFNAVTVSSRKFPNRAPDNWALLRLFFGGARSPGTMLADDDQLLKMALAELGFLFGVTREPAFYSISRWPVGNPIYEVGHLDRLNAAVQELPHGLLLAGSAYHGVGIPDVIRDANEVARRLIGSIPSNRREESHVTSTV
ncbi:protoporphyrinogen oxidase [soil metagenome]